MKGIKLTFVLGLAFIIMLFSCTGSAKKEGQEKKSEVVSQVSEEKLPRPPAGVAASVNEHTLSQEQLNKEVKANLETMQGKIPEDKKEEVIKILKRRIVDEFIARKLLKDEAEKRGIKASNEELSNAINELKRTLPPGVTMEEMLKKNGLTQAKLEEELKLGIQIKKLLEAEPKAQAKPSEKDIKDFYDKNKDKFKSPEMVHVRHILVAVSKEDTDATKAAKREKAENIRKKLLSGADFAQVAKEESDCPSKNRGGDLGFFTRGQMVKKFEEAAFRQKIGEIGPVVETEFGWHIIQVVAHMPEKTQALTKEMKTRISEYLERQNKYATLNDLLNRLKGKAKIAIAEGI